MLAAGQVINGTYQVDRRLGCGGMADVFLVTHARLPRQFALKLLRVEIGERRDFLDRFRREAEILATVRSAHIVDVVDWDYTYDGQPYLAMEYLEGETLAALLHRSGALQVETALDIFAQIGEGLCAAHAVGVVHRDLKPSNIFLDRHGGRPNFVKILDFGIAKLTEDARTPLTAHASVLGTPGYMAPEQALGRVEQLDHRADQFALAVILYEMLAGQPAFYVQGEVLYRTLERVIHEDPPPLPDSPVARALQRALAKAPEQRYESVREFVDTVLAAHEGGVVPISAVATLPWIEGHSAPRRRWQGPLAATVLIVGGGLLYGLLHGRGGGPRPAGPPRPEATPGASSAAPAAPPAEPHNAEPPIPAPTEPMSATGEPTGGAATGRPAARVYRNFTILSTGSGPGISPAQEKVLRICADKELRTLPGLPAGVIQLERSGALQVVAGPRVVYSSGLTSCLRQAFAATGSDPPRAAAIRVQLLHR
jgi:tRNA A-37 threonylcarbamoyl transferase component Bud32